MDGAGTQRCYYFAWCFEANVIIAVYDFNPMCASFTLPEYCRLTYADGCQARKHQHSKHFNVATWAHSLSACDVGLLVIVVGILREATQDGRSNSVRRRSRSAREGGAAPDAKRGTDGAPVHELPCYC